MAESRQNDAPQAPVLSTGSRVGHLKLVSDTGKRKNGYIVWKCACDCGGEIELDSRALKRGTITDCGCITSVRGRFKDITGQKFGMLTALYPTDKTKPNQGRIWHCICDCGREADVALQPLVSGNRISCGCKSRTKRKDLTGKRFGRLTVIEYAGKKNKINQWKCVCDCGSETIVAQSRLINGTTTSCGCVQKEAACKNLRCKDGTSVIALENAQNRLNPRNKSGHTGVFFNKVNGKWLARLTFKGVTHNLGSFVDKQDAIAAREAAEFTHTKFLADYYAQQCASSQEPVSHEQRTPLSDHVRIGDTTKPSAIVQRMGTARSHSNSRDVERVTKA